VRGNRVEGVPNADRVGFPRPRRDLYLVVDGVVEPIILIIVFIVVVVVIIIILIVIVACIYSRRPTCLGRVFRVIVLRTISSIARFVVFSAQDWNNFGGC